MKSRWPAVVRDPGTDRRRAARRPGKRRGGAGRGIGAGRSGRCPQPDDAHRLARAPLSSTWYCAGAPPRRTGRPTRPSSCTTRRTARPPGPSLRTPARGSPRRCARRCRRAARCGWSSWTSSPRRTRPAGGVPWRGDRGRAPRARSRRHRRRSLRLVGRGRVALRVRGDDPRRVRCARAVQPVPRTGHGGHRPRPRRRAPAHPGLAPGLQVPARSVVAAPVPVRLQAQVSATVVARAGRVVADRIQTYSGRGAREHGGGGRGGGVPAEGPRRHPRGAHARRHVAVPVRREGRRHPRAVRRLQPR